MAISVLPPRSRGSRARWELVLLLGGCLLELDLLLPGYLGRWGDLRSETVKHDFGLFEVATGIYMIPSKYREKIQLV